MDMKKTSNKFVKHYFLNGISKCSQISIVCLVLHLISFPVTLAVYTAAEYQNSATLDDTTTIFYVLSLIFSALGIGAGIMMAIGNFSYLHKKHEADTYYSLPLSAKERFWCDYFSGLLSYIVPMIIAQIVTFCISLITMGLLPDMRNLESGGITTNLGKVVLQFYAIAIVLMIMFYTISVLACVLCGNIFETILSTVLINGALPGLIGLLFFIAFNKVPTINWGDIALPWLAKTSPVGGIIAFVSYGDLMGEAVLKNGFFLKFLAWLVLFSAIYAVLSYVLYKIRKAEAVSKPYVFKGYYYTLISVITFSICAIIPVSAATLTVPMILVATVTYLIFETISNRGFKNLRSAVIRNFATIVGSILVIAVLSTYWGFGIARRVPEVDDIESVTFNYINPQCTYYDYYDDCPIKYTDKEVIKIITNAHKQSVESVNLKNAIEDYEFSYDIYYHYDVYLANYYNVTYTLKSGKVITRNITLSSKDVYLLTEIETTDEYVDNILNIFDKAYEQCYPLYVHKLESVYTITPEYYYDSLEKKYINMNKDYDNFSKDMYDAIKKDLADRSLEEIRNPKDFYCIFRFGGFSLFVTENDENMVRVMEKYDSVLKDNDYYYNYEIDEDEEEPISRVPYIYSIRKEDFVNSGTNLLVDDNYENRVEYAKPEDEEMMALEQKLMESVKPYTFDEGDCYAIEMEDSGLYSWWYIPKELNADAEKFMAYAKENLVEVDFSKYNY